MPRSTTKPRRKRGRGGKSKRDSLTPKQRLFVEAYCGPAKFNATEAAKVAGYSEKTARVIGPENLSKPAVRNEIEAYQEKLSERFGIKAWEVQRNVRRIVEFDHRKAFGPGWQALGPEELDDDTALALNKIKVTKTILQRNDESGETLIKETVEFGIPDRLKANELAAKMGGFDSPRSKDGDDGDMGELGAFLSVLQGWRDAAASV